MKPTDSRSLVGDSIAFCPPLAKALGVVAALLLQQIHYWCCEKKNKREGYYWVYNTSQEWAKQLEAFDERTIRNALTSLRKSGVVVTGVFNRWKQDKTLWYRIDYEVLTVQLAALLPDWKILPDSTGKFFHLELEKTPVPSTKDYEPKTTEETLVSPSATQLASARPLQKPSGKKIIVTKGPSSSATILEQFKISQGRAPAVPPNTGKSAAAIWRTIPKYNEGVSFMAELTLRQRAGLSYIVKQWRTTADSNLKYLIQHWVAFTKFVAAQKGLKKTPDVPDIGFLQKYVGEAASFVMQQSVQLVAEPVTVKPVSGKLTVVLKNKGVPVKAAPKLEKVDSTDAAPANDNDIATLDDVLKWKPKSGE